jgi:hypothetical protein
MGQRCDGSNLQHQRYVLRPRPGAAAGLRDHRCAPRRKGPHPRYLRTGLFTSVKGNARIVVRLDGEYQVHWIGEDHDYRSIEIPAAVPALLQNPGDDEALVLNMPSPVQRPDMDDEHTADFSDFDSGSTIHHQQAG